MPTDFDFLTKGFKTSDLAICADEVQYEDAILRDNTIVDKTELPGDSDVMEHGIVNPADMDTASSGSQMVTRVANYFKHWS